MLFGGCGCLPVAGFFADAAGLCAGGAGFISAMVAAMAHRRQEAEVLMPGKSPPVVDRLAVRILTDNVVINFVPGEKREGLTIERGHPPRPNPDEKPRHAPMGEWGLSMHAQSSRNGEERNILVDFGYTPEALLNNMAIYGFDPAAIDAMVLSHGHYDHFGGMTGFLSANKGKLRPRLPFFVGGEDAFCLRRNATGSFGAIDRKAINEADLALMMAAGPAVIADHGFTTGRIAQVSFEQPLLPTKEIVGIFDGFGCYPEAMPPEKNTGQYISDDFDHEIATNFVVGNRGLVVLTSCSHRGVINAVKQAQAVSGVKKVLAVIGGFHIVPPLDDTYIRRTIEAFREIDPAYIIPGHCSGDRFYDLARDALGDRVIHSAVGMRFVFEA